MPTYQTITVDITPGAKVKPVLNASQFDNGRPFAVALTWEGVSFTDADDFDIEIHVKKPDGNIVTAEPDSVVNEVCLFHTTEQMCACHGNNECEIVLFDNDIQIGTGNFILDVEKAPDEGGIQSASEIANLEHQIEVIIPEVIGDDYYNKTQTDALLANKADISDLPDMTNYYDKSQTDTLLAAKADTSSLASVAFSGDYNDLINTPVIPTQVQADYTQEDTTAVDYIKNKPDISGMIADALLAVMPVETSGPSAVCNFNTDIATNLVSVKCTIVATGGGGTPSTPIPIVGHSELNLTRCGSNQWDEEWEEGRYDLSTGEKIPYNTSSRSKGFIPVVEGLQYCFVKDAGIYTRVLFYNANKEFISAPDVIITGNTYTVITIPSNARYMTFFVHTTSEFNVSINYPSTDTSYHAYNGTTDTIQFEV